MRQSAAGQPMGMAGAPDRAGCIGAAATCLHNERYKAITEIPTNYIYGSHLVSEQSRLCLGRSVVQPQCKPCLQLHLPATLTFGASLTRLPFCPCSSFLYRMARKPALTLLHLGPGLANSLANLHNARRAGTPVVNLVGELKSSSPSILHVYDARTHAGWPHAE